MAGALWIGDAELPEFAPAAEVLRQRRQLTVAPRAEDALQREPSADWELAVVAEAFPGERWSETLDVLRRRRPTLPIVRLCGPGCDGELRSHPPATAHRYRWLEAPAAFQHGCDLLDRGECPSWGRPVTQSVEECLLAATPGDSPRAAVDVRIGLATYEAAVSAWLSDAARTWGAQVVRLDERREAVSAVDVVLWQVPDDRAAADENLERLRKQVLLVGLVALVAFPRVEQVVRLQAAGVLSTVALPATTGIVEQAVRAVTQRVAE